jgi:hypothetical protein
VIDPCDGNGCKSLDGNIILVKTHKGVRQKSSIATATLFSEQIRMSRAPSAPRSGFTLDILICSEATVAVAIDGAK